MNRFKLWLFLLFSPSMRVVVQEAINKGEELDRRVAAGEDIRDITVLILDERPVWDQGIQGWVVETDYLSPGRRVMFKAGRGEAKDDYAFVTEEKIVDNDGVTAFGLDFQPESVVTKGTIGPVRFDEKD